MHRRRDGGRVRDTEMDGQREEEVKQRRQKGPREGDRVEVVKGE